MPLILPNRTLFLHTFRTGGTWVREACQAVTKGECLDPGGWHLGYRECRDIGLPFDRSFTFIREPVAWMWSVWNYFEYPERLLPGRDKVDRKCTFREFVDACHEAEPGGWATQMFLDHIGIDTVVCRYEDTLSDQLLRALFLSDEPYDLARFIRFDRQRRNPGTYTHKPPEDVAALIRQREPEMYRRWYPAGSY